jgi:hypothetical protein
MVEVIKKFGFDGLGKEAGCYIDLRSVFLVVQHDDITHFVGGRLHD